MAKKNNKLRGVYTRKGKTGVRYGIDYIHPLTGQRVKKILKDVTSEADALNLRNIELTDARRGAINKAYGLKSRSTAPLFGSMVEEYLKWAKENKGSWETDEYRSRPLKSSSRANSCRI